MFLTAFKEQADAAFKMIQVADDEVRVKRVRKIPVQLDVFHRYLFADLLTYLSYLLYLLTYWTYRFIYCSASKCFALSSIR